MSPIHLRPSAPVAEDALLPGDPGRALAMAQELLVKPVMSNHARGLWGYHGETEEGRPLTIQSTGMGGPSAAIVFAELAELGVKRAIRVGTCGALGGGSETDPELELGDLVAATATIADDGTSARISGGAAGEMLEADRELTEALAAAGVRPARIATTDLFYDEPGRAAEWIEKGAVAVEMEAATLFALGAKLRVRVACVLAVSDLLRDGRRRRIADPALADAGLRMGSVAAAALAATR